MYGHYCIPETISAPQNNITVPLLMPLVTLMERQAVVFEGMELWESSDQSGEIMLRHLGTARLIAQHAETFRLTAEQLLQGRRDCCTATPAGAVCLPMCPWMSEREILLLFGRS